MDEEPIASNQPKPRFFRIGLMIVAILFLAAVIFAYFLPRLIPGEFLRSEVSKRATAILGRNCEVRSIELSWFTGVNAEGIKVSGETPESEPLFTVDKLAVRPNLWALLSGKIEINEVALDGVSIRLRREKGGKWNLPPMEKPEVQAVASSGTLRALSGYAYAAETAVPPASKLPAIAVNKVEVRNAILAAFDQESGLDTQWLLEALTVDGGDLNGPLAFRGRLHPIVTADTNGAGVGVVSVSGTAELLKGLQFDPAGKATVELTFESLSLAPLAAQVGIPHLLTAGDVAGLVRLGYQEKSPQIDIENLQVANVRVLANEHPITVPPVSLNMNGWFDVAKGQAHLEKSALTTEVGTFTCDGWLGEFDNLDALGLPKGVMKIAGNMELSKLSSFAEKYGQNSLPVTLEGSTSFVCQALLRGGEDSADAVPLAVAVAFAPGEIKAQATGMNAGIATDLGGVTIQAALGRISPDAIDASVRWSSLPVKMQLPEVSGIVTMGLKGGAVASMGGGKGLTADLRITEGSGFVPETRWAKELQIAGVTLQVVWDANADLVDLSKASIQAGNGAISASINSARFTGMASGKLVGKADTAFAVKLADLKDTLSPLLGGDSGTVSGAIQGGLRMEITPETLNVHAAVETDGVTALMAEETASTGFSSKKSKLSIIAQAPLIGATALQLRSLDVESDGANISLFSDPAGKSRIADAAIAPFKAVLAAIFDPIDGGKLSISKAQFSSRGFQAAGIRGMARGDIASGQVTVDLTAKQDSPLVLPISGSGGVDIPKMSATAENLVFKLTQVSRTDEAQLGTISVALEAGGYLGMPPEGSQAQPEFTIHNLDVGANPIRAQMKGRVNTQTGVSSIAYRARVDPSRAKPFMEYFGIPPTLFGEATVDGTASWDGEKVQSKGNAKGVLGLSSGAANPFVFVHEFAATMNHAGSILIDIKQLGGQVLRSEKDIIMSLQTKPDKFELSGTKASGTLTMRIEALVGPMRQLAIGLSRAIPSLASTVSSLDKLDMEGLCQALIQVHGNENAVSFDLRGQWKAAQIKLLDQAGPVVLLSEPQQLGGVVIGEYAFPSRQLTMKNVSAYSNSAQARFDGSAIARLLTDPSGVPNGIEALNVSGKFLSTDLTRIHSLSPGGLPDSIKMKGRVDGTLKATGNLSSLKIVEAASSLQGVSIQAGTAVVNIPNGGFNLAATLNLAKSIAPNPSLPYDALRHIDATEGKLTLTGVLIENRAVQSMGTIFELRDGIFNLGQFEATLAAGPGAQPGGVRVRGSVDFNQPAPAADFYLAGRQLPLPELANGLADFYFVQTGAMDLPAVGTQGTNSEARVEFSGFEEDQILATLQLSNFSFATGPVTVKLGDNITQEIFNTLAKQGQQGQGAESGKLYTFKSITGTIETTENLIQFSESGMLQINGDNTGSFGATGGLGRDKNVNMDVYVLGGIERMINFPNIMALIKPGSDQQQAGRFMQMMNANAEKRKYHLKISGPMKNPQPSGIPQLILVLLGDITLSTGGAAILNTVDIGKGAGSIVTKGLGRIIGQGQGETYDSPPAEGSRPGDVLRNIFQRGDDASQQQQPLPQQQPQFAPTGDVMPGSQPSQPNNPGDVLRGLLRNDGGQPQGFPQQQQPPTPVTPDQQQFVPPQQSAPPAAPVQSEPASLGPADLLRGLIQGE